MRLLQTLVFFLAVNPPTRVFNNQLVNPVNTAVYLSQTRAQAGVPWFCQSQFQSVAYNCAAQISPAEPMGGHTALTIGQFVVFNPDVSNTNTGAATLCVQNDGTTLSIKLNDGTTDPAPGQIAAGHFYLLIFDGAVWRMQ
jgi:hypothetical protein